MITNVAAISYSSTVTASATAGGTPASLDRPLSNVFTDSNFTGTGVNSGGGNTTIRITTFTFPQPIEFTTSLEVLCYNCENSPGQGTAALGWIDDQGNASSLVDLVIANGTEQPPVAADAGLKYAIPNLTPGTKVKSIVYQMTPVTGPADTVYAFYVDGKRLIDGVPVLTTADATDYQYFSVGDEVQTGVTITAIDQATPSITVNGGSWSGSDGSGDPGGETTVKGPEQQIDTTANLVFDGQGNVTGMTSAPVPYVNMDNKLNPQLIFGNDLGAGQPPDTELPAGTSIQTTAKAFNTKGESIVSSNVVIPGGTARASSPSVQEDNSQEFLTTAASIITHDERVVAHEAGKLQSQMQLHQQQLDDLQAKMKKASR